MPVRQLRRQIAFAAICRIGEHGRDAGEAFDALAKDAPADGGIGPNFIEGCAQIEEAVNVAIA